MATAGYIDADAYLADIAEAKPIGLLDIMRATNAVTLLPANEVSRIGSDALREFETDLASCRDFHERYDRAMDCAMQVRKPKTYPWLNASNVIFPLLTQAAVQFQARAYPAIIDGGNVVKGKVRGADPDGAKQARAERIAAHMTWQFLYDVPGWEDDTDKLLLQLPIVGCVFRKTWRDPIGDRNNSETVPAKDVVVHADTVSFEKAPRITHVQRYYPHEIEGFIRAGIWQRVPYDGEDGSDPHSLVEVLEQHRLIDMDGDGLAEPYVITMTREGAVARITAAFDMDGVFVSSSMTGGQVPLSSITEQHVSGDIQVVRIVRRECFTKYSFIPAPDGSFYDIGFGTLTEELGQAVNTIINQLIDAGTLSNMQGGFLGSGTKIKGGNLSFTPGEWKRVEGVGVGSLRDNILPLQLPGPSTVLFQLLGMLIDSVKGITSVSDILVGQQETQTAPTTALALIEQGQKVFTAIYQRIHRSLGSEIRIMFGLNRDYASDPQSIDIDGDPQDVTPEDYQAGDVDVLPISDPRAINDQVRMAKAQILMSHNNDPLINQLEIRRREFEAAGISDTKALFDVPPPPPDPALAVEGAKQANERDKTLAAIRASDAMAALNLVQAATGAYALGQSMSDPQMVEHASQLLADAIATADDTQTALQEAGSAGTGQSAVRPGGVQPVDGGPADAGVPPVPGGSPSGPGGDVGAGDAIGAGGPNAGEPDAGPVNAGVQ